MGTSISFLFSKGGGDIYLVFSSVEFVLSKKILNFFIEWSSLNLMGLYLNLYDGLSRGTHADSIRDLELRYAWQGSTLVMPFYVALEWVVLRLCGIVPAHLFVT